MALQVTGFDTAVELHDHYVVVLDIHFLPKAALVAGAVGVRDLPAGVL